MDKNTFLAKFGAAAHAAAKDTGIFAEVIIAAAATESSWGESGLTVAGNNFFGIKSTPNWEAAGGKFQLWPTAEYTDDKTKADLPRTTIVKDGKVWYKYTIKAKFRKYDSVEACFENYVKVVTLPRYIKAGVLEAKTPAEQVAAIAKGGYSTGPKYSETLISIIDHLPEVW